MTPEQIKRLDLIESNLLAVLAEIQDQEDVGKTFPPDRMSFLENKEFVRELLEVAGENGIAYESLVGMLELHPFKISGPIAIKLLEVALLMGYKSELPEDAVFDRRKRTQGG